MSVALKAFANNNNPAPSLTSISPAGATARGSAVPITVNSSDFLDSSVVNWKGNALSATFVSATKLTVGFRGAGIAGTLSVSVFTPAPGGGTSAPPTFSVSAK